MIDLITLLEKSLAEYRKAEMMERYTKSPEWSLKLFNRKQALANIAERFALENKTQNKIEIRIDSTNATQ